MWGCKGPQRNPETKPQGLLLKREKYINFPETSLKDHYEDNQYRKMIQKNKKINNNWEIFKKTKSFRVLEDTSGSH